MEYALAACPLEIKTTAPRFKTLQIQQATEVIPVLSILTAAQVISASRALAAYAASACEVRHV